ncbi:MAG: HEAT repeat domain-containing protein [Deltaproteobacteria bacterium]|nr:HEAT repeat domain-containing protein [Deltaproteobacteria bacterium]MBW1993665.1 HEAT repeat domain-containing protein [Deltaproteobacteria bacterium]MBW2150826.1 HEAT repeat domain-containing protein [Deltaproteobacteria bacterium]
MLAENIAVTSRQLKQTLKQLLAQDDFNACLESIRQLPPRRVIGPLFSFFFAQDELVKWRSITATGVVVSDLANQDMEAARVIMRRLMWNLNDESGGIGWGSPEAMGEIMSRHERLADEFSCILISYIREGGNFVEHEMLQRGVIWAIGRLAHVRPELCKDAVASLCPYLQSRDPVLRGITAWTAGALPSEAIKLRLEQLTKDRARIRLFFDGRLIERTVGQLAEDALLVQREAYAET